MPEGPRCLGDTAVAELLPSSLGQCCGCEPSCEKMKVGGTVGTLAPLKKPSVCGMGGQIPPGLSVMPSRGLEVNHIPVSSASFFGSRSFQFFVISSPSSLPVPYSGNANLLCQCDRIHSSLSKLFCENRSASDIDGQKGRTSRVSPILKRDLNGGPLRCIQSGADSVRQQVSYLHCSAASYSQSAKVIEVENDTKRVRSIIEKSVRSFWDQ